MQSSVLRCRMSSAACIGAAQRRHRDSPQKTCVGQHLQSPCGASEWVWPLGRSWESARTLSFSRQAIAAWSLQRDACCDVNRDAAAHAVQPEGSVCNCMPRASALEMARVSSGLQFSLSSASAGTFRTALWRGAVDGIVLSEWLSRERTCFSVAWSSWDKV